ncbi:adenylate/guanylate cyclase domain-containing protein [Dongia rigui]|uniref:Adenylate/guanylate cyclase domain-containing protein n=1 Tax=Dongia rigui TaxID=940149 RepID=A0ABU5DYL1_9PROT|nr:adenylate/guanylate cyclase domain-containing protein [Dongia rigui]MDY0872107.1 adenylate/guanylate cyclase domain-containing protein [Dongia rigui]
MTSGARQQSWTWSFKNPPQAIWPLLADTARFNEAAKLPRHRITEIPQADGSVAYLGDVKLGPFDLKWQERPVNWVSEQFFEHIRDFSSGPVGLLGARFELKADPATGGSVGTYTLQAEARNWIGRLILGRRFFDSSGTTFGRLAAEADRFAAGETPNVFATYAAPPVAADLAAKVARIVAEIEATPNGHGLAQRLADHVLQAQEVDLWHIRPIGLARHWGVPERHAIELCLQAVKAGLLELRWDLLCPRCRVAKAWAGGLDRLPTGAHCTSCNIDYDRDFSQNVEASFRPAAGIRSLESGEYCMWGPMSVPHVKAQIHLVPGETRDLPGYLPPGPYRLRTLAPGPAIDIEHDGAHFPALVIAGDSIRAGDALPPGSLRFANKSARPHNAIIESRHWVADCLTADRVTALQAFRDLFSEDVLRPGDEVSVGRVTLLFSDLKASTALYQQIGDAAAYHLVRDHFAFMTEIIREHDGAVVKTIGDAVMAAFARPQDAVAAALAIQQRIGRTETRAGGPIVIKLGLHQGPTIAVTLNDRLDYFGSTVNMAARLQGQARGGDIVLSDEMRHDPSVAPALAGMSLAEEQATLKGFAAPLTFYRLTPSAS